MTQKSFKILIDECYSKAPKKNCATNKADIYNIDSVWSLDILHLKDYGREYNIGYRYVSVVFDDFSKNCLDSTFKTKNARTITNSFENILKKSKRKSNLFETDRGKDFYNNIFQKFLHNSNIKHCF